VVGTSENLPLLRDGPHDHFERRSAACAAEGAGVDLAHDDGEAAANRAKILQPTVPEKPTQVGAAGSAFQRSMSGTRLPVGKQLLLDIRFVQANEPRQPKLRSAWGDRYAANA